MRAIVGLCTASPRCDAKPGGLRVRPDCTKVVVTVALAGWVALGLAQAQTQPRVPTLKGAVFRSNGSGGSRTPGPVPDRLFGIAGLDGLASLEIGSTSTPIEPYEVWTSARAEEECWLTAASDPDAGSNGVDDCLLPGGVGHVAAGVGLRESASGVVQLLGAPAGSVPVDLEIVFAMIAEDRPPWIAFTMTTLYGQTPVVAERVAEGPNPCWGDPDSFERFGVSVYRARPGKDVLVPGINGLYGFSDLPGSANATGESPFEADLKLPEGMGISMTAIYSNAALDRANTVYAFDHGAQRLIETATVAHRFVPAPPDNVTSVRITNYAGDGQTTIGLEVNPETEELEFGYTEALRRQLVIGGDLTPLSGGGSSFVRDGPFQGRDGVSDLQQLWDTESASYPNFFADGASEFELCYDTPGYQECSASPLMPGDGGSVRGGWHDCVSLIGAVFELRVGEP